MGKWAVIERMIPIINSQTGQITKKSNLGVIIDMSCLLTTEERLETGFDSNKIEESNHQKRH